MEERPMKNVKVIRMVLAILALVGFTGVQAALSPSDLQNSSVYQHYNQDSSPASDGYGDASGYGYDISLSEEDFYIMKSGLTTIDIMKDKPDHIIDPRCFDSDKFTDLIEPGIDENGLKYFIIKPGNTALGITKEWFDVPNDVIGIVKGKSTYSRCGIGINITPLENGWKGKLIVEIHSFASAPVKVYANAGIAQVVFFRGDWTNVIYNGKYQNQAGMTFAKC